MDTEVTPAEGSARRSPSKASGRAAGTGTCVLHLPSREHVVDELLTQVGGHVEDDVALLALRAHPEVRPRPAEAGPTRDPRSEDPAVSSTSSDAVR